MTVQYKGLASFEWASVAQYLVYVSSASGMSEINFSHVISFPYAKLGGQSLKKRKVRLLALLRENMRCLQVFAGRLKDDLTPEELGVLRSLYKTYKLHCETVEKHLELIDRLDKCEVRCSDSLKLEGEENGYF